MRALYVTRDLDHGKGGANVVIKRNMHLFRQIASKVDVFEIKLPTVATRIRNILFRESFGETKVLKSCFIDALQDNKYDLVFFDGSYYGGFLELASSYNIKTACFFHNVEYKFYLEKYKLSHKYADRIMASYIHNNESKITKHADYIISINERDSNDLFKYYKRRADGILPTSFDPIIYDNSSRTELNNENLLFIGTKFFANIQALDFIVKKIAPYISKNIIVLGDVCETVDVNEVPENIKLLGSVDSLDSYYKNASAIIAPIFSGSGLKTKSVEALRYGKTIIGTKEALEGIPINEFPQIGICCNSDSEFIDYINNNDFPIINEQSLVAFNKYFSHDAQLKNLRNILKNIISSLPN